MTHTWAPTCVPWWVPFTHDVRFEMKCTRCGAEKVEQVTVDDDLSECDAVGET